MSLFISHRRRKILFTAVALVGGGYASYQLYKSPLLTHRRKQLLRIFKSVSFLGHALSQSAESLSIVSEDLKAFLISEDDEVPRSLRQAFKIGQCPDFKQSLVVFCTALTEGILEGKNRMDGEVGKGDSNLVVRKPLFEDTDASVDTAMLGLDSNKDQLRLRVEGARRKVRDVRYIQDKCEVGGYISLEGNSLSQGASWEKGSTFNVEEAAVSENASCVDVEGDCTWETKPSLSGGLDGMHDKGRTDHRGRVAKGFSERFLGKLFTDSGAGFASAVVGSVVRNLALTLVGGLPENKKDVEGSPGILKNGAIGSLWDANFGRIFSGKLRAGISAMQTEMGCRVIEADLYAGSGASVRHMSTLDLLCSEKCRSLIAECIQNFVSSAVSVYIDKTKDINYYDDVVAGITNPAHQAPMKELLISVCNAAVDTLVRTSHEVMFLKGSAETEMIASQQKHKLENISGISDEMSFVSRVECQATAQDGLQELLSPSGSDKSHGSGGTLEEGNTLTSFKDVHVSSAESSFSRLMDGRHHMQSWIEGVSRTLAIPSNRMLLMDVAGKMTSEAVHSVFEVMTSTISSCLRRTVAIRKHGFSAGANNIAENGKGQLQERYKFIMKDSGMKFIVLATICLALYLHVFAGVSILQRA